MSNLITFHVGEAGIQLGKKLWTTLLAETEIGVDGIMEKKTENGNTEFCFQESSCGSFTARALFLDSEPTVIEDSIFSGRYKRVFASNFACAGKNSSANCYARGKFECYKNIQSQIYMQSRRRIESCDNLAAFYIYSSLAGGTGSGFVTNILGFLEDMVPTITKHMHCIFPSGKVDPNPTAEYNAVLSVAETQNLHDLRFLYDNRSLYREVLPALAGTNEDASFHHINHLVGNVTSRLTAGERFFETGAVNQHRLATNLIPFPSHKMISAAYISVDPHSSKTFYTEHCVTSEAFLNNHELCTFDIFSGKYYTSTLQYCVDVVDYQKLLTASAVVKQQMGIPFASWIPKSFGIGFVTAEFRRQPEDCWYRMPEKTLLKLSNHSNIFGVMDDVISGFEKMYSNRCFVSFYVREGMEEGEFSEALETVQSIQDAAKAAEATTEEE